MPEVIRERAYRENETWTRWRREKIEGECEKGDPGGRGSCICHNLIWLHNRIPTRRDHPCQQVTYFFHSVSLLFFVRLIHAAPRPTVAILSSSLIRDDCLIPCLVSLCVPRCTRYEPCGSFRDNPFADSATGESLRSFQVEWGVETNDALKFLIQLGKWRTNARVR